MPQNAASDPGLQRFIRGISVKKNNKHENIHQSPKTVNFLTQMIRLGKSTSQRVKYNTGEWYIFPLHTPGHLSKQIDRNPLPIYQRKFHKRSQSRIRTIQDSERRRETRKHLYITDYRSKSKKIYKNYNNFKNQSAEGAGGMGIIRGNKVGESEQRQ